jgi:hypothetical protein
LFSIIQRQNCLRMAMKSLMVFCLKGFCRLLFAFLRSGVAAYRSHDVAVIRPDTPAPGDQREGEPVRPTGADVPAGPELCNEFPDPGGLVDVMVRFRRAALIAFSARPCLSG